MSADELDRLALDVTFLAPSTSGDRCGVSAPALAQALVCLERADDLRLLGTHHDTALNAEVTNSDACTCTVTPLTVADEAWMSRAPIRVTFVRPS